MTIALAATAFLVCLFAASALLLFGRDRAAAALWKRRNPPQVRAARDQAFRLRLMAPNWDLLASTLRRPVPDALVRWFGQPERVGSYYYFDGLYVAFLPIDRAALSEQLAYVDVLPFAHSDGDLIHLAAGEHSPDAVFITYHDGGDTEQLAPSVESFLQRLKEAK